MGDSLGSQQVVSATKRTPEEDAEEELGESEKNMKKRGRERLIFPQDNELIGELRELNTFLQERNRARGSREGRRLLAGRKGKFFPLRRLQKSEIQEFFQDAPLVGVDGSLNTFGASFPCQVTLFRALAKSSRKEPGEGEIWAAEVFSPLLPDHQKMVEEEQKMGLGIEEALARVRWKLLASLEVKVGRRALEKFRPRMILWDGAFARLETHAPEAWKELRERALSEGVLMLGITEEIATSVLSRQLEIPAEASGLTADREILFDLLDPGEAFYLEEQEKEGKGRVYVRFSWHPQVIAVDYLPEQEEVLPEALSFLYTITPSRGRGFPLWLDVVDAEVRLTAAHLEGFLAAHLDPHLVELFLRPLRWQRDY
ncbi:MAG: NurA-like protein [Thermoanaerobacterales bacterium 50_218]|nr:MAG: NurA-like protein [Thermoanaerobacterales bacterium 50_218]